MKIIKFFLLGLTFLTTTTSFAQDCQMFLISNTYRANSFYPINEMSEILEKKGYHVVRSNDLPKDKSINYISYQAGNISRHYARNASTLGIIIEELLSHNGVAKIDFQIDGETCKNYVNIYRGEMHKDRAGFLLTNLIKRNIPICK